MVVRTVQIFYLLAWSGFALGENDAQLDALFNMSLDNLMNVKVVSATLHEQSLESVPASVTVYTREQIRAMGITRLDYLMNFVPGFQSQRIDDGVAHNFSSRGFSSSANSREILILLDGERVNTDFTGAFNYALNNLDKVERVEFIRGPGSAIYGSNAYMGVINLITQAQNEASVALGDNGQREGYFQWSHSGDFGQSQLFVSSINDEGQNLQGYNPLSDSFVSIDDPYQFKEIHFKGAYQDFKVSLHHSETKTEQFYTGGFLSENKNGVNATISYINMQYDYRFNEQFSLSSKANLTQRRFEISALLTDPNGPFVYGIEGEIEEQEPQLEWILNYNGDQGSHALLGVEWRQPKITDSDANLYGALDTYLAQAPLTDRTIYGVFAQYQGYISRNLEYVLGLRHDDYSNFGSHQSPRGGLIYQLTEKHAFKWLYGESYRAPSRVETDVQNSAAVVANPNLKPEVARTTELIWQSRQAQDYLASTLFYTELSDVISNAQTTPIERYNTGDETLVGLELEWYRQWSEKLHSNINASWIFDGPSQVNPEAEFFTGMSLIYQNATWSSALMLNQHGGKEDAYVKDSVNETRNVKARSFLDANVRWFLPHKLELSLRLNNITDERYNSVALGSGNDQGVPNRGTSVLVGLRWGY
jgi:outer membrane cobalamin receptor